MADNETPQGEAPVEGEQKAEIDWKAEARKWESRAKENLAAAKANEDAAKRLADLEEAQKSEAQKLQERLAAAERRAAELELKTIRAEIAAEKGLSLDLISKLAGSSRDELVSAADALLAFKGEQAERLVVPDQGKTPSLALNGEGIEGALRNALGIQ